MPLINTSDPFTRQASIDYWCFHSPYNKLVKKSYARLGYWDDLESGTAEWAKDYGEGKMSEREFDKAAQARVAREYERKFERR